MQHTTKAENTPATKTKLKKTDGNLPVILLSKKKYSAQ